MSFLLPETVAIFSHRRLVLLVHDCLMRRQRSATAATHGEAEILRRCEQRVPFAGKCLGPNAFSVEIAAQVLTECAPGDMQQNRASAVHVRQTFVRWSCHGILRDNGTPFEVRSHHLSLNYHETLSKFLSGSKPTSPNNTLHRLASGLRNPSRIAYVHKLWMRVKALNRTR